MNHEMRKSFPRGKPKILWKLHKIFSSIWFCKGRYKKEAYIFYPKVCVLILKYKCYLKSEDF